MDKDKFDELIERAKQGSREDFLRFVTGVYGVDECVFDHMWKVPVIAPCDGNILVTTPLSTKTEDELLDIVNEFIDDQLGKEEGCFISLGEMKQKFKPKELEEWQKKLDSGELKLDYNAIIVYNEPNLQKQYEEIIGLNSTKAEQNTNEKLDQIFVDYVKGVITHERCHLNADYLVREEEINGAMLSQDEYNDLSTGKINTGVNRNVYRNMGSDKFKQFYKDRNEVLVDTLSKMMNNYQEGDSIEDCLLKIIEDRNGKSQYEKLDDREVLTMYALFPEELTEWVTFGAYDFIKENKLQKMIIDVCGTEIPLNFSQLNKKVEEYVTFLKEDTLSEKQTQMLEMLGFSKYKKIYKKDLKAVATSEGALSAFSGSLLDVKTFIQSMQKEDTIKNNRKEN